MDFDAIDGMMRRVATEENKQELASSVMASILLGDKAGLTFLDRSGELVVFSTDAPKPVKIWYGGVQGPNTFTTVGGDSRGTFLVAMVYAAKTTNVPMECAIDMVVGLAQAFFGCPQGKGE